ncbi:MULTISPECIES: alpha-N-acetylglucosaminidase TIM-barrel domain-containing protein [unclassified Breznakia]|uniref:alpha-N-acetylglucosaminidase TIM-barrel domain-containing protein n=1 Tax=unclassified Breznakia TaxID=2623764 RepID=UPI002475084C|nr:MULTISPECIES: alpha-N-acetylglucosaminidase TIM-barrel domain-containing protein [unclassified Breznakia]MDH6366254.1 hypothetical protein [Breznakia sp. PH1-1]MDH6403347.1 hypothetical protein [Breznakia sp. PF1-11]MDH6411056.1 hypothetical protein [Breznakia sp. PFB1-11]MDH6413420.1 hypothetical protein [Breznakia sp. PFB1-14]MDH6416185.1 hypothetical protein [Breznakia sp. PFB1-4]
MPKLRTVLCVMFSALMALSLVSFKEVSLKASQSKIENITATGKSSEGKTADLAVDGDKETYYQTPASNSQEDHYRNIDLQLDGLYELSEIKIFNKIGAYYNYQIYVSETGSTFQKVAFKNDTSKATEEGDTYVLDGVKASIVRINLSYNSTMLEGNLAEVEVYGNRIGDASKEVDEIKVSNFEDTKWKAEYDKVASDSTYASQKTTQEMTELVGRVIGEEWKSSFTFEMTSDNDGNDIFEIENGVDGTIVIRGNNGIAMASGFNYYLRNYCKVNYNPIFASQLQMPTVLPQVESKIVKETEYDYRYALNFCTYSYTMAFWDWDEYEAFLDWAAMSGINTVLDIVGQEEVVRRTLKEYGYSDTEIKEYISGPGYFAWYYMQNMTGYGGPLPDNWFENRVELGRQMHDRMQTYGITPVLSGFSGMVPSNFKSKFTDAAVIAQGDWCGYIRPDMLATYVNSGKDYFDEMADVFYQAQKDLFGDVSDIYAVDPFHEGGKIGDMNVTKVYEIIQKKMMEHDADAIWLIQQWQGSMSDAKLQGLKEKDHALVLDLFSEINSQSDVMERNEIPWVWNMLHNFGGRMGLDANPSKLAHEIPKAYASKSHMKGIGMTPEALENSPMAYELLWDMTWTKDAIDYRDWVQKYAERNYGGTNADIEEVWNILLDTGYNQKNSYYQGAAESVINARPTMNFTSASTWGHSTINYDKKELEKAVYLMARNYDEFKDSPAFLYDLSDITRQVIANSAQDYHKAMVSAYNEKDSKKFYTVSEKFLEMIQLQDQVLSTNDDFLVGNWIEDSRSMLSNADDWTKDLFEFNARSLITTWGGKKNANSGGLKDYSNRQWAGLTKDYYYPRWETWVNDLRANLENGTNLVNRDWFMMEWKWVNQKSDEGNNYATESSTLDLQELALKACENYSLDVLETIVGEVEEKENIALGKNVTSSVATSSENQTSNLTDGNKNTPWKATTNEGEFTLTVDLEAESSIDGMEISLPQLAGGFPYAYTVEVLKDGQWTIVASQSDELMTSQTLIDYRGIGSQVRFTFSTSDTTIIPEVTELIVYGKAQPKIDYVNLALTSTATSNKNSQGGKGPDKLIDDKLDTLWVNNGESYPITLTFDLSEEERVDIVELFFEKRGLRFKYKVSVEDGNGNRTVVQDMSENTDDLDHMYKIGVHANVKKVIVEINGKASGGDFPGAWPALAEVRILQEKEITFTSDNIAAGKTGIVSNSQKTYETSRLTNDDIGDLENIGTDVFPTTFTVDLGKQQDINEVKVYFEKAGIRFKFKVEVEDESGKKTTILDKLDNTDDLDAMYSIPTSLKGSKIHVVIEGRAPGGNFYLASPALAEIKAFTKPTSMSQNASIDSNITLSDLDKDKLVDNDYNTFVSFNDAGEKQLTFTFEKPVDIYAYELYKDATTALQYKVEYASNAKTETWNMLDDESNNIAVSKKHVSRFSPVLTNKVRLTLLNETVELHDFNLYKMDANQELETYVNTIVKALSEVTVGEYSGNYSVQAKDALDGIIATIKDALTGSLNTAEVNTHMQTLKDAYATFLKSYVTIDRTTLLVELIEVKALLKTDELKNDEALQLAYTNAKAVYDEKVVKQSQLDEATKTLRNIKIEAIAKLDSIGQYKAQLAIAQSLKDNTTVGANVGNVSKETMDTLVDAISKAEKEFDETKTATEIDEITTALETAIQVFKDEIVTYNKDALIEAIALASSLNEKDYTKDSWKAIEDTLAIAIEINKTSTSMDEIELATTNLLNAITQKVNLNREELGNTLNEINELVESTYSKDSWKVLQEKVELANAVYNKVSLNQNEIDEMVTILKDAIDNLSVLNRQSLIDQIREVQLLNGEDYTLESWNKLLVLCKEAEDLLAQVSINQSELDTMTDSLKTAIRDLVVIDLPVDKDALDTLLTEAKKYVNSSEYTLETYYVFELAYAEAQKIFDDKNATASQVQEVITKLQTAIDNLEVKPTDPKPIDPDKPTDGDNKPHDNGGGNTNTTVTNPSKDVDSGDATNVNIMIALLIITLGTIAIIGKKKYRNSK